MQNLGAQQPIMEQEEEDDYITQVKQDRNETDEEKKKRLEGIRTQCKHTSHLIKIYQFVAVESPNSQICFVLKHEDKMNCLGQIIRTQITTTKNGLG